MAVLPPLKWSPSPPALALPSVQAYEELALSYELEVQHLLQAHNYNTVANFIRFYEDWRRSGVWRLREFYVEYRPVLVGGAHTCVGLGLECARQCGGRPWLVSCEEAVAQPLPLPSAAQPSLLAEKEHVLVCCKVTIAGRQGALLLDPGYHVARVVTVMEDSAYPHTGWFTQTNEPWVKREYRYFFLEHTTDYVVWEVKETRGNKVKTIQNLIYIAEAFDSAVEFTEKRNLVYDFKSWLARNFKGEIVAGIYFGLEENGSNSFTITCTDSNSNKQRLKFSFSDLLVKKVFSSEEMFVLDTCGQQLGTTSCFLNVLCTIAEIMSDSDFISQVLDINEEINNISV